MATLTQKITDWVTKHGFERVALQFPDALLADAPEILQKVCLALKERRVFILGDSSSGGGGVDEVGALHYGADCIIRFGHAEQQRGGELPVLFVFGDDNSSTTDCVADADEVVHRVQGLFAKRGTSEADVFLPQFGHTFSERVFFCEPRTALMASPPWNVIIAARIFLFDADLPFRGGLPSFPFTSHLYYKLSVQFLYMNLHENIK